MLAILAAPEAAHEIYEGAKVSEHVTSRARDWSLFQGIIVTPSARLPSDLQRPTGSGVDGMSAAASALLTMSFVQSSMHGVDAGQHSSCNSVHGFPSCPHGHRTGCTDEGRKETNRATNQLPL